MGNNGLGVKASSEGGVPSGEFTWDREHIFDEEVCDHLGSRLGIVESVVDAALDIAFGESGVVPECNDNSIRLLSRALDIVCNPSAELVTDGCSVSESKRVQNIVLALISSIVQCQSHNLDNIDMSLIVMSVHLLLEVYVGDYIENVFAIVDGAGTSVKLSSAKQDRRDHVDLLWTSPGGKRVGFIDVKSRRVRRYLEKYELKKKGYLVVDGEMVSAVELILPGSKDSSMVAEMLLVRLNRATGRYNSYMAHDCGLDRLLLEASNFFFGAQVGL
ncbi:MAG: hypothetical protein U9Q67_03645 [Patescibacteria group bacterium]|nr:hypothetical protein [Patescibacteria group bacterium]